MQPKCAAAVGGLQRRGGSSCRRLGGSQVLSALEHGSSVAFDARWRVHQLAASDACCKLPSRVFREAEKGACQERRQRWICWGAKTRRQSGGDAFLQI